jgi:hypothetical protein
MKIRRGVEGLSSEIAVAHEGTIYLPREDRRSTQLFDQRPRSSIQQARSGVSGRPYSGKLLIPVACPHLLKERLLKIIGTRMLHKCQEFKTKTGSRDSIADELINHHDMISSVICS